MELKLQDEKMIRYLLGRLSEKEQEEVEEAYFTDSGLFERMLAVRDELIDDYLRNGLSLPEREQFERHFMASPQRRERVEEVRALMQAVSQGLVEEPAAPARARSEPVPWRLKLRESVSGRLFVPVITTVALLVFLGGIWLIFDARQLRRQLAQSRSERTDLERKQQELQQQATQQQGHADRLAEELARAQQQLESEKLLQPAPLTLLSRLDRGARNIGDAPQKLVIPPGASLVRLQLRLKPGPIKSYRAELQKTSSSEEKLVFEGLKAQPARSGGMIEVILPASYFTGSAQTYVLTLNRKTAEGKFEEFVDTYSFQIDKKKK
jgi:hypothetical protein